MPLRHLLVTAAAAGTAGALALTAPVVARSVFDARNAHKVDGLHAAQLTKIQGYADNATFDNFDTCTFTSVLTRTFRAPHSGVIAVTGQVVATKDFGSVDDALLVTRVVVIDSGRIAFDGTREAFAAAGPDLLHDHDWHHHLDHPSAGRSVVPTEGPLTQAGPRP